MATPRTEPEYNAAQDANRFPALIGHSGTAGTAEIRRVVVTDAGAISVDIVSGESINIGTVEIGTVDVRPLSGVVLSTTVGIGTTATTIPGTALTSRKSCILYNNGTTSVYLGGTGVTTTTGLLVGTADYSPSLDLGTTILYGIAGTVGGTVNILEIS